MLRLFSCDYTRVGGMQCARACVLAAMIFVSAMSPRVYAEIWGYVDENGVAHTAPNKVDERYQLFFRGEASKPPAAPSPPPISDEVLELMGTALYRRLADEPNVARFEPLILANASAFALDPALLKAVIAVESAYEPAAVSQKGALGLMQVMVDTGVRYGVVADAKRSVEQKLLDPTINVRIGARYLRDLLVLFNGDITLALAGYNAGEGAVARYANRVPPFRETQEYVKLVQRFIALYRPPPEPPPPAAPTPTLRRKQPRPRRARTTRPRVRYALISR